MTELLRRWVNDEVKVSRTVKNFDADFCNGYLFGEILARYDAHQLRCIAVTYLSGTVC